MWKKICQANNARFKNSLVFTLKFSLTFASDVTFKIDENSMFNGKFYFYQPVSILKSISMYMDFIINSIRSDIRTIIRKVFLVKVR